MAQCKAAAPIKKHMPLVDLNSPATCSEVNVFSVLSDYTIVKTLPVTMNRIAVKSYFQLNFSPKQHIASVAPAMIPVAALLVSRVMSANGSTTIFI